MIELQFPHLDFFKGARVAFNDLTGYPLRLNSRFVSSRLVALLEISVLFLTNDDDPFDLGFNVPGTELFLIDLNPFRGFQATADNAVRVTVDRLLRIEQCLQ